MNDPLIVAGLSVLGTVVVLFLGVFLVGGFNMGRVSSALRSFGRMLRAGPGSDRILAILNAPPKLGPSAEPVRLLSLLQREGRLIDFLLEDIQGADEATVGAAVKEIQRKCKDAIQEHLVMEPVIPSDESSTVTVPVGFDPSAIRLTGNVTGQPPFKGTLQHRGWRVKEIKLGPLPEGQDGFVLAPAEVELP